MKRGHWIILSKTVKKDHLICVSSLENHHSLFDIYNNDNHGVFTGAACSSVVTSDSPADEDLMTPATAP